MSGWNFLSLQILPNDLETGFLIDWSKIIKSNLHISLYVWTRTLGSFTLDIPSYKIDTDIQIPSWINLKLQEYKKIILIIAGHGTGKGIKTQEGELTIDRLARWITIPVEIIILDSCMMATNIVVNALKGKAKYLIATQDYCPWEGFIPHSFPIINDTLEFCKYIVDDFIRRNKDDKVSASILTLDGELEEKSRISKQKCRIDPLYSDSDYACQLGKFPSSVIYTKSTVVGRSGVNLIV